MRSPVSLRIRLISAATVRARSRSRPTPSATPVTTISAATAYMMDRPMELIDWPSIVEKLYSSSIHAVLRADDHQTIPLDPPLEQRRAVSQLLHRRQDIGPRGPLGERHGIVRHRRGS